MQEANDSGSVLLDRWNAIEIFRNRPNKKDNLTLSIDFSDNTIWINVGDEKRYVKYVHELEATYFELTGERIPVQF